MIGRLLRGGFMTAIYAYLYIPIIILIVNSFNSSRFGINWQGFTTKWYELLVNNDSLLQAAQHSLTMAIFSATFATLIGSLTAVALYRYRFRETIRQRDAVCSNDVAGYRDGDLPAGAVYVTRHSTGLLVVAVLTHHL